MREKYIEEVFPRYFEFGKHADGRVDIATCKNDTVATVSREHATNLIADRDALVQKLCDMALAFDKAAPEVFTQFWYGHNAEITGSALLRSPG